MRTLTRWRRHSVPAVVMGVVTVLVGAGVGGCGNVITTDILGALGVSVDATGAPMLIVAVCSGSIDSIQLYEQDTGKQTATADSPVGTWRAVEPVTRRDTLSLSGPTSGWKTVLDPPALQQRQGYSALGLSTTADAEVTQVDFVPAELEDLPPRTVSYQDRTVAANSFHDVACSKR